MTEPHIDGDRQPRPGNCGAMGKRRFIRGAPVYFWKRPAEGIWWPDYSGPGGGLLCGYCGVPASTLLDMGVATRTTS